MSEVDVKVDRIACTGHGICAQLLSGYRLDAHGYPIVDDPGANRQDAETAIKMCPARALYLQERRAQ